MFNVAIYARVSDSSQIIETQLLPLREYCEKHCYLNVKEYVDNGFSGKDQNRPQFELLLADMRANRINCVIVARLDRIGRSLQHLISLFAEFKKKGIEFISISQNIDTKTPEGKMFWQLLGVFAEYERELIVARTKSGLERARKEGKTLGRPQGSKDKAVRRKCGYFKRWEKRVNNTPSKEGF